MAAFQRVCDSCGRKYEAQRKTSRFCSSACRSRQRRAADVDQVADDGAEVAAPAAESPAAAQTAGRSGVAEQVRLSLQAAARLESVDGQSALALAAAIDRGTETGSALAGAIKQLRETMRAALDGHQVQVDVIDELQERRAARRATL